MDEDLKREILGLKVSLSELNRALIKKTWETRFIAGFYLLLLIGSLLFAMFAPQDPICEKENFDHQIISSFFNILQEASAQN